MKSFVKQDGSFKWILGTLLGFVAFWAMITDAWGYSSVLFPPAVSSVGAYLYGYISRLLWVLPAFWLLFRYQRGPDDSFKNLFSVPTWHSSLILVLVASLGYAAIGMVVTHGGVWFTRENLVLLALKYSLVGFVEETVFRGWGYRSLTRCLPHGKAALLSTACFVLLHWPAYWIKWLRFGVFDLSGVVGQSVAACMWGVLCCWLLDKGKSLWSPILAHAVWDLACVVCIRGN